MEASRYPTIEADSIGWITEQQMIEVDREMIEDLRIGLLQMMENAGRNLARVVLDLFAPRRVAVAAGSGGNGGGGLVAARHLANAGADVVVTTTRSGLDLSPVTNHQFDILERMGVDCSPTLVTAEVTIDALIGYSLQGPPRGRSAELIAAMTLEGATDGAIVALDVPSGLDVTDGSTPGAVVAADVTMTLALPKVGLREAPHVGELLLADISVPRSITEGLGPAAPDFSASPIVRVQRPVRRERA